MARGDTNPHIAADLRAMTILREVAGDCVRADLDTKQLLRRILDAAIALTGAQKGNVQLLQHERGTLRIAVQRGFEAPFLSFFADVRDDASACADAMRNCAQVIVDDVTTSDIFAGQVSQDVLLDAGVRAVISIPLISSRGTVLGMISTHFDGPHRPHERDLNSMILLARQAADYLERKQAQETEQLLVSELQHRSNNLLSVVQSIVHGSFAGNGSREDAKTALEARIGALLRASQQLTASNWTVLDMKTVADIELAPFRQQTTVRGAYVALSPREGVNMSMAMHELVTNAVKYGALSTAAGHVAVSWTESQAGTRNLLNLDWLERNGPPVTEPKRRGFGTSLLQAACVDVRFDFARSGFGCQLSMPLG